ncbi:hypothetical protein EDF46_1134 [Frondihabitans sp. PhB188]|uniref:DUF6518 family protein n=1 Tax=Frondihabitans sp. PhB188 TaxID=2485200 RepID=UPI000F4A93E3|nr:DUF6518 family protein [Frondihabitans sp. PhB188]ROQ39502.1 hypothetical protein EDF46_1134 [Frondihabitans sp. PhB188]
MSSANAAAVRHPWRSETVASTVRAVVIVLVGAALIGGATSPAQGFLPDWLGSLANSAGGWSMFAFLLVWLSRARPLLGAILGIVAFEAMLEAYGVVSIWRGYYYAAPLQNMYTVPGIAAGLILGACAAYVRWGRPARRWLAVLPLTVVLMAEGAYGLLFISDTTSPVYWTLDIVAGAAFLAAALWRSRRV